MAENENNQPSPNVNADQADVRHVSIKAPEFSETAINGWFPIMEAQFSLRGITQSSTKFYSVIAALPAEVVCKLPAPIIDDKNYDRLKEAIIFMYERTKPEMLDKLMKTTSISGRPSLYLQELSTLAGRIGASDDIVRHKFLQALPKTISPVIASQKDLSLQQLGKLADELLPFLNNNQVLAVNQFQRKQEQDSSRRTFSNRSRADQAASSNNLRYGLKPYHSDQKQRICRAHLYFADKAKSCTSWCRWPNKQNVHVRQSNSRPSSPARSEPSEN